MITIANRRDQHHGEYVGRPSPLGNPFPMDDESDRDDVCDEYGHWFAEQLKCKNKLVLGELHRLQEIHRLNGELTISCWCAPKRCHAETIKSWLEQNP